jgi:hypothetical protein
VSKYTYQSAIGEVDTKIASQYQNDICIRQPAVIIAAGHYFAIMNKQNSNYLKRLSQLLQK